jgi:hypothetical protein
MTSAEAKERIDTLKNNFDFGKQLLAGDRAAKQEWDDLHKIWQHSASSVAAEMGTREAEWAAKRVAYYQQRFGFSEDEAYDIVHRKPISAKMQAQLRANRDRMIQDSAFQDRLNKRDREAEKAFYLTAQQAQLPVVRTRAEAEWLARHYAAYSDASGKVIKGTGTRQLQAAGDPWWDA